MMMRFWHRLLYSWLRGAGRRQLGQTWLSLSDKESRHGMTHRQRACQRCMDFSTPPRSMAYDYVASRTRKCIAELALGRQEVINHKTCVSGAKTAPRRDSRRRYRHLPSRRAGSGGSPPGSGGGHKRDQGRLVRLYKGIFHSG